MFYLAHISDPHLGPLPRPAVYQMINKRVTGYLNWHFNRRRHHNDLITTSLLTSVQHFNIDHYAITGDLINLGLKKEIIASGKWLRQLASPEDLSLVPGNHSAYTSRSLPEFIEECGQYMRSDHSENTTFPYLRIRGRIAIIGLSSACPTMPFMATGKLGSPQIARLARLLQRLRQQNLIRVIMLHHPPYSKNVPPSARLKDAKQLRDCIGTYGAELVLHGHTHKTRVNFIAGPDNSKVPVSSVASTSANVINNNEFSQKAAAIAIYAIDDLSTYPVRQTIIQASVNQDIIHQDGSRGDQIKTLVYERMIFRDHSDKPTLKRT